MKEQKPRRIGRLAEAKLQIQALTKLVAETTAIYIEARAKVTEWEMSIFNRSHDSNGSFLDVPEEDWRKRDRLWDERMKAEAKTKEAKVNLQEAEIRLAEILDQMRPGAATVTTTNKNRVPFAAPEMESNWDEAQDNIESEDDRLRFSQFVSESTLDRPNCKGCRRARAHHFNANSKPSKARK